MSTADAVLFVEDAGAPLAAEPLLTTPLDSSSGAAADRAYAGALSSLVAPPGRAAPLSSAHASDELEQLDAHEARRRGGRWAQPAEQDVDEVELRRAHVKVVLRRH